MIDTVIRKPIPEPWSNKGTGSHRLFSLKFPENHIIARTNRDETRHISTTTRTWSTNLHVVLHEVDLDLFGSRETWKDVCLGWLRILLGLEFLRWIIHWNLKWLYVPTRIMSVHVIWQNKSRTLAKTQAILVETQTHSFSTKQPTQTLRIKTLQIVGTQQ